MSEVEVHTKFTKRVPHSIYLSLLLNSYSLYGNLTEVKKKGVQGYQIINFTRKPVYDRSTYFLIAGRGVDEDCCIVLYYIEPVCVGLHHTLSRTRLSYI